MSANPNTHNVSLFDRKRLEIVGVKDVKSFDERQVSLLTVLGEMLVGGDNLQIEKLDMDAGEIHLSGMIHALQYTDEQTEDKRGFFSRLFS